MNCLHFSSRCKKAKTSKMGKFTVTRFTAGEDFALDKNDPVHLLGTLYKTAVLCTIAVRKLSSHLMISNNCPLVTSESTVSTTSIAVALGAAAPATASDADSTADPAEDVPMSIDGDQAPTDSSNDARATSSESGDSSVDYTLALQCAKSILFMGRFAVNSSTLLSHLFE
jgi:hypothetical protein